MFSSFKFCFHFLELEFLVAAVLVYFAGIHFLFQRFFVGTDILFNVVNMMFVLNI